MPVQRKSLIGKTAASNKTTSKSEGNSLKARGMTALSMAKKTSRLNFAARAMKVQSLKKRA